MLLTALDKRETFLAQLFLWKTPLDVALLITETASFNAASAAALSLSATAASTFLIAVLTEDLIALFLAALVLFTKILFFADLIFANSDTSNSDMIIIIAVCHKNRHGRSYEHACIFYYN